MRSGLVPCIVGAWGYYLGRTGIETMKKHWEYLVARYGAYPVVWCVAGEPTLPFYDSLSSAEAPRISGELSEGWSEVTKHLRSVDPYQRPLTVHPSPGSDSYSSYDIFSDPSLFDIDMLQTGHNDQRSFGITLEKLERSLTRTPPKPVINGEVCYEGIAGSNWQDTQRFLFWTHMLSGAAGHTYGAQGIWGFSSVDSPFTGLAGLWGESTWEQAYRFAGSEQLGIGKRFLERYAWHDFEPHPEWVNPHCSQEDRFLPYAAGIPGKVRVIYLPGSTILSQSIPEITILGLEREVSYEAHYFNPRTGEDLEPIVAEPSAEGEWKISGGLSGPNPSMEDWILVLESR